MVVANTLLKSFSNQQLVFDGAAVFLSGNTWCDPPFTASQKIPALDAEGRAWSTAGLIGRDQQGGNPCWVGIAQERRENTHT